MKIKSLLALGILCVAHTVAAATTTLIDEPFNNLTDNGWSINNFGSGGTVYINDGKLKTAVWNQTNAYTSIGDGIQLGSGAEYSFSFSGATQHAGALVFFLTNGSTTLTIGNYYWNNMRYGLSSWDPMSSFGPEDTDYIYKNDDIQVNNTGAGSNRGFTINGTIKTQTDGTNVFSFYISGDSGISGQGVEHTFTFNSKEVLNTVGFGMDGRQNMEYVEELTITRTNDPVAIPEPATAMLALGGLSLMGLRRRRQG